MTPDGSRSRRTVFGEVAAIYEAARPGYPAALVDDVLAYAAAVPADRALEVGAGTGKATLPFVARGLGLTCLEPSGPMADILRKRCAGIDPAVVIEQTTFEDWPPQEGAFRLLISGQAWHWVPPEVSFAKAHLVLAPGGTLALFWNFPVWSNRELRERIDAVYGRFAPELKAREPGFIGLRHAGVGDHGTEVIAASGLFDAIESRDYRWSEEYSTARYVDLLSTQSDHRLLPQDTLAKLLTAVGDVVDAAGGCVRLDYLTKLLLARRR